MDYSSEDDNPEFTWSSFLLQTLSSNLQTPTKRPISTPKPPKKSSPTKKLLHKSDKLRKKKVSRRLDFSTSSSHDCTTSRSNIYANIRPGGGGGSSGKWLDKTTPKKKWFCYAVRDLGEVAATCEMCERERIRYVHTVSHTQYHEELEVGCICAGHLTGDSALSKERQSKLEQRLKRRENFPGLRNWKVSKNGNPYIVFRRGGKDYWVVITRPSWRPEDYSAMIEDKSRGGKKEFINKFYKSKEAAQLAAFDHLFPPQLNLRDGEPGFDFGYDEIMP